MRQGEYHIMFLCS